VTRALVVVLVLLAPAPAAAQLEDQLGLGTRSMALGGSYAARPGDFASLYYDPAGLAPGGCALDTPGFVETSVDFVGAAPFVSIEGLDGGEIDPVAPARTTSGFILGARFDLGWAFDVEGLAAGFSVYLPGATLATWSNHPDDRIQWLHLTDRTQRIGALAGLGWRITRWLSVGASARILFDMETLTTARVTRAERMTDMETGEEYIDVSAQLGEEVHVYGRVAPIAGVLVTPMPRLRLAATYHGESQVEDWGWTRVDQVPAIGTIGFVHRFSHHFEPHQVTVAAAFDVSPGLTVSADATYAMWSRALSAEHRSYPGRFGDTLTPAVGVDAAVARGVRLLAGYRFVRRTFENFGGPTNLLDSDQHVGSVGLDLDLAAMSGKPDLPLDATLGLMVAWLPGGQETKDWRRFVSDSELEMNPGRDGYRYGGVLTAVSVGLRTSW
jgi:hypothetical protein